MASHLLANLGTWAVVPRLCACRQFGYTDRRAAAHVDSYLARENTIRVIRQAIAADNCRSYEQALQAREDLTNNFRVPEFGVPILFSACQMPGLVTDIVKDNCVGCFKYIQQFMPELCGTYVNDRGWILLGVAVSSGSLEMIKHFCNIETFTGPGVSLLGLFTHPANILYNNIVAPTVLDKVAQFPTKQFPRDLFTFIMPWFREIGAMSSNGTLSTQDLLALCSFVTPEHADEFEMIGVPLYNVSDPALPPRFRTNAYHAGAKNGPEFLDYLDNRSTSLSPRVRENGGGGSLPIHHAIRANRLDCVIWLQEHGGAEEYNFSNMAGPWVTGTTAGLASRMTSDESVAILRELLAPLNRSIFPHWFCLGLLSSLLDGCLTHDYASHLELTQQELDAMKGRDEARAIQKARMILTFPRGDFRAPGVEDAWNLAISRAENLKCGFDHLANCFKMAAPRAG